MARTLWHSVFKLNHLRTLIINIISMKTLALYLIVLFSLVAGFSSCKKEEVKNKTPNELGWIYDPVAYTGASLPRNFPSTQFNYSKNPLTEQGVKLGRMLFYDPILSGDSTLACAGCHKQENAFTDDRTFSVGIDGLDGRRQSMPLFNLMYGSKFFWDGRAATLAEQVLMPVEDPKEMHETWPNNIAKLQAHPTYPQLFYEAFGVNPEEIAKEDAAKAMEQFLLTLISGNSKFDKAVRDNAMLTDAEERGYIVFNDQQGGDCFHCHGDGSGNQVFQELNAQLQFRNNGLDTITNVEDFIDKGLGETTGNSMDNGKFKVPSLRNLKFTAPYMHDGRFATLEEVVEHYSTGVKGSPTIDRGGMEYVYQHGVQLTAQEKSDLIAFLLSLSDDEFVIDPRFSDPFK